MNVLKGLALVQRNHFLDFANVVFVDVPVALFPAVARAREFSDFVDNGCRLELELAVVPGAHLLLAAGDRRARLSSDRRRRKPPSAREAYDFDAFEESVVVPEAVPAQHSHASLGVNEAAAGRPSDVLLLSVAPKLYCVLFRF